MLLLWKKIMVIFILSLFCLLRLTSGSTFILSAIQMVETSVRNLDELKLLSTANINSNSLLSGCITDAYLIKNRNKSATDRSAIFTEVTVNSAKIQAARNNSGLVKMELNITFPIRQTEKTFAEIMLKAATIKLTSFIVKNSTKDFCDDMQCPKDPLCTTKMDPVTTNQNIKQWKLAGKASSNITCQYLTPKGIASVQEGIGKVHVINFAVTLQMATLNTAFDFHEWSANLPESFFKGLENLNMTTAAITLSIMYSYDVKKVANWFFTTEGIVNLVLMGILGFNLLIIIISLLFCACNRSKRAFDMEMWEYAMSRKNEETSEEF